MSCQRLALREPGTLVCASSSISATSGAARDDRVDVQLGEGRAPVDHRLARDHLQALEQLGGAGRPWVSTRPTTTSGAALQPPLALAEHREGLADAGGRAQIDPQPPTRRCSPGRSAPERGAPSYSVLTAVTLCRGPG